MDRFTVSSIVKVMNELFPKEASFVISDDKRYIYYQPSKQIDLKIRPETKSNRNRSLTKP